MFAQSNNLQLSLKIPDFAHQLPSHSTDVTYAGAIVAPDSKQPPSTTLLFLNNVMSEHLEDFKHLK